MELIIILIIGACAIGFFLLQKKDKPFEQPQVKPIGDPALVGFEAAPSLWVNEPERELFYAIMTHLPNGFYVHGKVRIEDVIRVKRGLDKKVQWSLRGRVKSRHIDYVIIDVQGRPILAIELDGKSHNPQNPSEADKVKTAIFAASGLPLRRICVSANFDHIAASIGQKLRHS